MSIQRQAMPQAVPKLRPVWANTACVAVRRATRAALPSQVGERTRVTYVTGWISSSAALERLGGTVCTFGNLSSLIASHSRLSIDGANLLTARREGRFDGAELPMVYGYGKATGRGIVIAAWRRDLGEAGRAATPTECVASSALARRVRPEDLRTYRCTGHDESLCRAY